MGLVESMCAVQNPARSASCQSFIHFDDGRIARTADLNPSSGLYPDFFYKTMNLLVGPNIEHSLIGMRLFNSLIFATLAGLVTYLLPRSLWTAGMTSWLVTLVPIGVFFIPSVNPSSWNIMGVGFAWITALGYLESRGWRSVVLGGISLGSIGLAIGARSDGFVFSILALTLALWLSSWNRGVLRVRGALVIVVTLALTAVLLFNPRQTGVVEEGFGVRPSNEEMPTIAPDSSSGILWNNLLDMPALWLGMFGGYPLGSLGWLDTVMPQIVVFSTVLVAVILGYLGLRDRNWRKLVAVGGGALILTLVPLYLLQLGGFLVGEEIQPRYLLPLMVMLMGVILLPTGSLQRSRLSPGMVISFSILLGLANSAALHANIRRYVTGITKGGVDLSGGREWWWQSIPAFVSPNVVWVVGSLGFALLAFLVLRSADLAISRTPK